MHSQAIWTRGKGKDCHTRAIPLTVHQIAPLKYRHIGAAAGLLGVWIFTFITVFAGGIALQTVGPIIWIWPLCFNVIGVVFVYFMCPDVSIALVPMGHVSNGGSRPEKLWRRSMRFSPRTKWLLIDWDIPPRRGRSAWSKWKMLRDSWAGQNAAGLLKPVQPWEG